MARGFVQSLNLFESQDAQSARSIMDNLAGEGINVDIRLFANNLKTTTEVSLSEYVIENAADIEFQGNTTVVTSGGAIEDYYRFVVGANRRDLLPFSTGTIVYVFDNNNAKRYHCVKNSDTLTVFELYDYTVAGGVIGSRNSWNDFIDLNNNTTSDLGSGGGIPGLIIAILMKKLKKSMKIKLYEKSHHKCVFLKDVSKKLELNTEIIQKDIFELRDIETGTIMSRAFKPMPIILDLVQKNFRKYKNIILFMGKSGRKILNETLKIWDLDYEEKKSLTNKDSFLLNIKNMEKKI